MTTKHQFCTFYVDNLFLGIEVQHVQEIIRYQNTTRVPLAPTAVCGLINLRGQIVTAIDVRNCLGIAPRRSDEMPMNVIVREGDDAYSLLIDRIGDVLEVEEDSFEPPPLTLDENIRSLIKGAYKLSGQLLLVLDKGRALNDCYSSANEPCLVVT
jgi:purine-binding chemotaxis protein CheW